MSEHRETAEAREPAVPPETDPPAAQRSLARTLASACLLPVVVFLATAWITSRASSETEPIEAWVIDGRRQLVPPGGLELTVGATPVRLLARVRRELPAHCGFAAELGPPSASSVQVKLLYSTGAGAGDEHLFTGIRVAGASSSDGSRSLVVSPDRAADLDRATEILLTLRSAGEPSTVTLRDARWTTFTFGERCSQMLASLLEPEPLSSSTNNAIAAQRLAGRGFGFVSWIALALATALLCARRLVLRERFDLLQHTAVTLLVLFVWMDLRNASDRLDQARSAIERRRGAADVVAQLDAIEDSPWFAALLRRLGAGGALTYHVVPETSPATMVAEAELRRLAYYARPARAAAGPDDADLVVAPASERERFHDAGHWRSVEELPGGWTILERIR